MLLKLPGIPPKTGIYLFKNEKDRVLYVGKAKNLKNRIRSYLVYFCLNGAVQKVALGDALSGSILSTFEPLVGTKARIILAAFAIGGDSGMSIKTVAESLRQSPIDIHHIVTELASGGVITEIRHTNTLSVNPAILRFALVRDTFFKGPT